MPLGCPTKPIEGVKRRGERERERVRGLKETTQQTISC